MIIMFRVCSTLCLLLYCQWAGATNYLVSETDSIPTLIEDGDFNASCLPEAQYKPYTFENVGHTNTPDILFLRKDLDGEKWYWKEFGCLMERLLIPFIPLHYACSRPGKEPPVPTGYSGDRYIGLIKERETTEALVFPLREPLLPGMAFRLRFGVRAMSDNCQFPQVLVAGSKAEPCQQMVNQLHPSQTTTL